MFQNIFFVPKVFGSKIFISKSLGSKILDPKGVLKIFELKTLLGPTKVWSLVFSGPKEILVKKLGLKILDYVENLYGYEKLDISSLISCILTKLTLKLNT